MKTKIFKFKNIKTTPDKLRLSVNLVRNKNLANAYDILSLIKNRSANLLVINLKASENSIKDWQVDKDNILIQEIAVDEGLKMKRSLPRSRGRMSPFKRRMSRLTIKLSTNKSGDK
ncbi:hypothetical protein COZ61_00515 [Candidatus Berkelbacteria bacterium CG_4_8_14_3_um_filter_33_6]|uniref:50S ribosomal protein L22 n=1 Tax=Candidatus Berkelbacteria bacterium CG_4_10_14_0_2_um_filter_35_9_33_12 TaxID=1974499 RepID=A0A2M7W5E6_9BACT|nr:MAG: hypothetical protein COX10_00370 [Candidatus Berkelbacteria bacterium CG23_combo_of_CG06-09_8_20_14_all_33_15]PIS08129.1 MAG: hypothetical protein COT76_03155 [Candidatus Berkelbacteria bacterium CG10_big_fil_rev_8_21_14_0_10_33_10]PIX31279.1 MAG: hypothetical protein COZ61_00515 [Candidatus Berkelbacteria bacterium CG_4_8_14_3_um_filter_33_6]PIZ28433.1 MAG: hypothetical protein COY43_00500 [Candidatus Berkelbacteria bacterium CG_4_10_14_0_8_um_filter_35_9_33_8]PJA20754.1 MAG: hypotheti